MKEFVDRFNKRIEEGKINCGVVVSLTDPIVSELIGLADYDFVWIEGEHAAFGYKEILQHMIAAHAGGAAAMVRLTGREPGLVKPVLDMGPDIIAFPWINTVNDAKEAISACKYPPKGVRGFNPQRAGYYGQMGQSTYVRKAEEDTLIWMIIEQKKGFDNLEEILQVEGVDGVVLGPGDLSLDLGFYGDYNEIIDSYMVEATKKCIKYSIPFLVWPNMNDASDMKKWSDLGASMFGFSQDTHYLSKAIKSMWDSFKAGVPKNRQ